MQYAISPKGHAVPDISGYLSFVLSSKRSLNTTDKLSTEIDPTHFKAAVDQSNYTSAGIVAG